MKSLMSLTVASLLVSCRSHDAQQEAVQTVDTVMADSAAKVIVEYQEKTGRPLNIVIDSELIAVVRRQQERRK